MLSALHDCVSGSEIERALMPFVNIAVSTFATQSEYSVWPWPSINYKVHIQRS